MMDWNGMECLEGNKEGMKEHGMDGWKWTDNLENGIKNGSME